MSNGASGLSSRLIDYIVLVSLGLVAYIVIVGGIVCVKDDDYDFSQYVLDLKGVYKLLLVAIIGVLARDLGKWRKNGNGAKS